MSGSAAIRLRYSTIAFCESISPSSMLMSMIVRAIGDLVARDVERRRRSRRP